MATAGSGGRPLLTRAPSRRPAGSGRRGHTPGARGPRALRAEAAADARSGPYRAAEGAPPGGPPGGGRGWGLRARWTAVRRAERGRRAARLVRGERSGAERAEDPARARPDRGARGVLGAVRGETTWSRAYGARAGQERGEALGEERRGGARSCPWRAQARGGPPTAAQSGGWAGSGTGGGGVARRCRKPPPHHRSGELPGQCDPLVPHPPPLDPSPAGASHQAPP